MKIIKKFEKNKSNLKVYLITLQELREIEVQLDKDKEPEIISFDRFLLMTEKELKEKEIEISSLQFLKMLKGTDIPVMIGFEKSTFGDFRISREKQEEMAYEVLKMPDEELVNIVFDEKIIKQMDMLIKSWTDTDLEKKADRKEKIRIVDLRDLLDVLVMWIMVFGFILSVLLIIISITGYNQQVLDFIFNPISIISLVIMSILIVLLIYYFINKESMNSINYFFTNKTK